jgi:hypothetical protein
MQKHRIQHIINQYKSEKYLNDYTKNVLTKISNCHSSNMGYHYFRCNNDNCNHSHYQYHGCKNRHCPSCNWQKQEQWQENRLSEILPVKYFHVVFTLPHELNCIILGNRKALFKQLFDSASFTLLKLCADPKWLGAMPSISIVLHTWGQQLSFHPHVHCIVSGGGIDKNLNWHNMKKKSKKGYLLPYDVMEPFFKKHFLKAVNRLIEKGQIKVPEKENWKNLKNDLFSKKWIVYAKPPMGSVSQVVEYLARYTYKVAISNSRIISVENGIVNFKYKDYQDGKKTKTMPLKIEEFVRRFQQHILPFRFVKIRHYGILGNFKRRQRINEILKKMNLPCHPIPVKTPYYLRILERYGTDIFLCPKCKTGTLNLIEKVFTRNKGSPLQIPESFTN